MQQSEYSAILDLLSRYYDGLYRLDTNTLAEVFHPARTTRRLRMARC